jgi:hypothetical protein
VLLVAAAASTTAVLVPSIPAFAASGHACSVGALNNGTTNDGTNEGVFCADVSNSTNGSTVIVNMGAEGICQNAFSSTSEPVQCANVDITFALWTQSGEIEVATMECGHNGTLCSATRSTASVPILVPLTACEQVWTVVYAGSTIELPKTGAGVTLGANLGSGHITICP